MLEKDFQRELIKELKGLYPDCMIFKNDAKQGYPDLIFLYGNRWASLEVKKDAKAKHRPNQDVYVKRMNDMSFSSFIYPENKKEVLDELGKFLMGEHK